MKVERSNLQYSWAWSEDESPAEANFSITISADLTNKGPSGSAMVVAWFENYRIRVEKEQSIYLDRQETKTVSFEFIDVANAEDRMWRDSYQYGVWWRPGETGANVSERGVGDLSIHVRLDGSTANVTTNRFHVQIDNLLGRDLENMVVKIIVPPGIHLRGNPVGRHLSLNGIDLGQLGAFEDLKMPLRGPVNGDTWTYSFPVTLQQGGVGEYPFSYKPEIHDAEFQGADEYDYTVLVQAYDGEVLLATAEEAGTVLRPVLG